MPKRERESKKEKEKEYYFNVYHGDLVDTFYMKESEAREKYGNDWQPDEDGNVIIHES